MYVENERMRAIYHEARNFREKKVSRNLISRMWGSKLANFAFNFTARENAKATIASALLVVESTRRSLVPCTRGGGEHFDFRSVYLYSAGKCESYDCVRTSCF